MIVPPQKIMKSPCLQSFGEPSREINQAVERKRRKLEIDLNENNNVTVKEENQ